MSEGVSSSKHWSVRLPRFLHKSWFVLVLGPPLLYVAVLGCRKMPGGFFEGLGFWLLVGDLLLSWFFAFAWLVLVLIAAAKLRGNLGRWLRLQAIYVLCFWMFLCPVLNAMRYFDA